MTHPWVMDNNCVKYYPDRTRGQKQWPGHDVNRRTDRRTDRHSGRFLYTPKLCCRGYTFFVNILWEVFDTKIWGIKIYGWRCDNTGLVIFRITMYISNKHIYFGDVLVGVLDSYFWVMGSSLGRTDFLLLLLLLLYSWIVFIEFFRYN